MTRVNDIYINNPELVKELNIIEKWSPKNKLDTLKNPTRNIRCTEPLDKCYALGNLYNVQFGKLLGSGSFGHVWSATAMLDTTSKITVPVRARSITKYQGPLLKKFLSKQEQVTRRVTRSMSNATKANTANTANECGHNVLVLMSEANVTAMENDYTSQMINKQKICNFSRTLVGTPPTTGCYNIYPECVPTKQLPVDFIITSMTVSGVTKYLIKGINGRLGIDQTNNVYINKFQDNNFICADINDSNKALTQTDLITTLAPTGNNLNTIIRFKVIELINGLLVANPSYIGLCNDCKTNCGTSQCTTSSVTYNRLCLYGDILDPSVISFVPVVKIYN